MSEEEFRAQSQMMPFPILWARNRLVYLQSLGKHAMSCRATLEGICKEERMAMGGLH